MKDHEFIISSEEYVSDFDSQIQLLLYMTPVNRDIKRTCIPHLVSLPF